MAQATSDHSLQPDVDRLHALVADLWYPSETDAPVTVVVWPRETSPTGYPSALEALGLPIAEQPADRFFRPILSGSFWQSSQGEHLAQRYQALQDFLQGSLSHLRTYRLGQVEVSLYLLGHHPSGHYLGVTTTAVET